MDDTQKQDDSVEEAVEAEVVTDAKDASDNQATVLLSLEEMIKNHIASLDRLQIDLKKQQEMFTDTFINSEAYRENDKKVKEANKVKATTKDSILQQPAVIQLSAHIKDMRQDIKERRTALSDYLREYQRLTGANEIEDHEGQLRDIVNTAKLVKRSAKQQK